MRIRKGFKYYIEYRECIFPEGHLYVRHTGKPRVDVISVWNKDGYYGTYFYNICNDKIERVSFYAPPKRIGMGEHTNNYLECFKGYTECITR